jgi:hypothetical protein
MFSKKHAEKPVGIASLGKSFNQKQMAREMRQSKNANARHNAFSRDGDPLPMPCGEFRRERILNRFDPIDPGPCEI